MISFLSVQLPFLLNWNKSCTPHLCVCVSVSRIGYQKLIWKNYLLKKNKCGCVLVFYMCPPTCFLYSIPPKTHLSSLHQGYFLTVSQLPLPWVMALCDSLSDSDEVMSEPRTKLSLLCPTETLSLLAFEAIDLFFFNLILRSCTSHRHFIQPMHWLAEYIT